jgi:ABC-type sugar transport system ATPase subunit
VIEGSIRNSFMHSLLAKGRLLYTHDQTIADLCARLSEIGERDTQIQLLNAATRALAPIYKAHKQRSKHTIYILDEPTTGLHLADIERLLESLNRLVDAGHTVLLIEHHLDVIKTADHVIDLGPEGGHAGGQLVVTGTPEEVAACKMSYTGSFLKAHLRR